MMRRTDLLWIAFGLFVSLGFGAANVFAWDPGATQAERGRMPAVGSHGHSGLHTYWFIGFGGK